MYCVSDTVVCIAVMNQNKINCQHHIQADTAVHFTYIDIFVFGTGDFKGLRLQFFISPEDTHFNFNVLMF
jgi:hypothetical protein